MCLVFFILLVFSAPLVILIASVISSVNIVAINRVRREADAIIAGVNYVETARINKIIDVLKGTCKENGTTLPEEDKIRIDALRRIRN